jgi:hypothetical protein
MPSMPKQSEEAIKTADTEALHKMSDDKFFKEWRKAELSTDAELLAQIEAMAINRFGPLSRFGMLYMWSYKNAYPEHIRRRHLASDSIPV